MWNNHSGHYTPSAADHVRVHLDPATFVAARIYYGMRLRKASDVSTKAFDD